MSAIDKATRVQRLLENQDLQGAFDSVENALLQGFVQAGVNDADTLHDLKLSHALLNSLKNNLHNAIQDGQLEQYQIEQDQGAPVLGDPIAWKRQNKLNQR